MGHRHRSLPAAQQSDGAAVLIQYSSKLRVTTFVNHRATRLADECYGSVHSFTSEWYNFAQVDSPVSIIHLLYTQVDLPIY